jgi:hypothetical protein
MIGLIPRPLHAVMDYLWGIAHYLAPEMLGYDGDEAANIFSKVRGGSAIGASLFTRYELGLIRIMPFNMHLLGDFLGALLGLAAPWLFGFEKNEKARKAVLGFAVIELVVVLLSRRDKK